MQLILESLRLNLVQALLSWRPVKIQLTRANYRVLLRPRWQIFRMLLHLLLQLLRRALGRSFLRLLLFWRPCSIGNG
jgi:hypothetical protein